MAFVLEFWSFLRSRKKFWLLPVFVIVLVFGTILVLAEGSAAAPFIYAIF